MFTIRFMKAAPTTYVLHYRNGQVRREGPGLSFFYYSPTSTMVTVPLASADAPFAFQESTADFQPVTIQGQLTYRVTEPKRLASLLDFSIGPTGAYRSEDYRKLADAPRTESIGGHCPTGGGNTEPLIALHSSHPGNSEGARG